MAQNAFFIADGRVHFTVPKLFKASLCPIGAHHDDVWFLVDSEFLFTRGGDSTGTQGLTAFFPQVLILLMAPGEQTFLDSPQVG